MQLKSGWSFQPDFQYIWQPGGNVPDEGTTPVENAAVFGARSTHELLTKDPCHVKSQVPVSRSPTAD